MWKVIAVVGTALLLGVFLIGPMAFNLMKKYNVEMMIVQAKQEDERRVTFHGTFQGERFDMTRIAMRAIGGYLSDSLSEDRQMFSIEVYKDQQLSAQNISALERNFRNPPPYYTFMEAYSATLQILFFTHAINVLVISSLLLVAIVLVVKRLTRI